MDLDKIFIKNACPTAIGGQAVIDGVMMRGAERTAITVRLPDGRMHIKTMPNKPKKRWMKVPIIRGVFAFFDSMVVGMKCLLYSADVQEVELSKQEKEQKEEATSEVADGVQEKSDKSASKTSSSWLEKTFGKKWAWNLIIYTTVIISLIVSIGIFIVLPTIVIGLIDGFIKNDILINLIEGIFRLILFFAYILAIGHMEDIKKTFQYHGAEHKTIHCFENNLELTPENAQSFYTLHPRCGTSFLMFVMVISIILFSFLGWPSLAIRILSRILLIPVVAGLSYELLRWAGRSNGAFVKCLSIPGIYLQKLTTAEPTSEQLEIAICSLKAVRVPPDIEMYEGYCDNDGNLIEERIISKKGASQ